MLLKSIPFHHRPHKHLIDTAWIKDGFEHCWTTPEYVAIAFLLGWILRVGEGCDEYSNHLLTWSMVTFRIFRHNKWQTLPMSELRTTTCNMVDLLPHSRKYQDEPRLMPGRMNTCHLADPSLGDVTWCHLCMPTLLQGWAIRNNIDKLSSTDRAARPILASPGNTKPITRNAIAAALRRHARQRNEDETTVVPTSLRKTAITRLANSDVTANQDLYLRAVGHHSIQSSEPYIEPGPKGAAAVTSAQQQST